MRKLSGVSIEEIGVNWDNLGIIESIGECWENWGMLRELGSMWVMGVLRELENFVNVPGNENVPRYENVSQCLWKTCSEIKDLEFHSRSIRLKLE